MGERGSLTHRKSAARIGVAPFAADSGKLKGSRHIRGGRDRPRTVRDRTAFSATFHNPDRIAFYQRLRNGGKPHKVALADRPGGRDAQEDRPHQRPAARPAPLGEPDAAHGRLSSRRVTRPTSCDGFWRPDPVREARFGCDAVLSIADNAGITLE